ncbi:MAG: polysaccharide biosynthesis C-terminal domain-containing protein [Anaerolineae bacterium]|nr:polysaccharide biosynthesis C-terminal domain-containing protein [Anaerolineae bacterium]
MDAFQIAITIPQDLYDLAIFGHTNSALVPVLTEYAAREDKAELWEVVSALASIVLLAAGLLTLGLIIFTPQVITLYRGLPSSGVWAEMFNLRGLVGHQNLSALSPAAFSQTVDLLRLTAPALIFMSLFAVFSGTLFALKRFTRPAFGAAVFNGVIVLSTLALVPAIGIQGVALGWVAGAVVQLLLVFGGLRGSRIRLALAGLPRMLRHPGLRRIGLLYLPVLLTLLIDVAVNRPFSYNIASQTGEGNIGYMKWATSLREFPMGLVGTAISIAILPTLARQALHIDLVGSFRNTLGQGVRLVLTLIVPAAVGMFVLAGPLIGLVFEHGSFTAANTAAMSIVLRLYLLGIPFAAIDLLLIFAFYARRDSLTPALIGMFSLACYIAITLILLPSTGFLSLMIADSAKHLIHMSVSLVLLRRRLGGLGDQRLFPTLAKVGLATGLMALITYALALSVADLWPAQGLRERVLLVVVPAMLGGVTYLILASLLRLNELSLFVRALTRRIRR